MILQKRSSQKTILTYFLRSNTYFVFFSPIILFINFKWFFLLFSSNQLNNFPLSIFRLIINDSSSFGLIDSSSSLQFSLSFFILHSLHFFHSLQYFFAHLNFAICVFFSYFFSSHLSKSFFHYFIPFSTSFFLFTE